MLYAITRIRIYLALIAAALTVPDAQGQDADWANYTSQGNQALADISLMLAAQHYEQALALSEAFRPEDLRRPTSLRNLAHVLTLTGAYSRADSLYSLAIALAAGMLPSEHTYLLTMREEHERLMEAILRSSLLDLESNEPRTLYERLVQIAENTRNMSTFQSGALMAITQPVFESHNPALLHILIIRRPVWSSGSLEMTLNLSRVGATLQADKNRFLPNFTFRGFGLGGGLRAGRWVLDAAAGPYKVRTSLGREIRPVITAGITRGLWDGTSGQTSSGYYLDLALNLAVVPVAPGAPAGSIMAGMGIALGYFHKSYD